MFRHLRRGAGFYQNLFKLAFPLILQNLITTSLGFVDTFMVGLLGSSELSAVTAANTPIFLVQVIIFGLLSGQSVLVSQYWGKGDQGAINRCSGVALYFGLSITALGGAFSSPERFCGMHWINPANLIPLVEVISGDRTAPETAQTVYAFAENLEKKPISIKDVPGFALNRLQFAVLREALHMVETGVASMEDVDRAMKYGLGLRYACVGPFETADLGGLDIFCGISEYLFADLADDREPQALLREKNASGKLGVKSGEGFYDYSGGRGAKAVEERNRKLTALCGILFS